MTGLQEVLLELLTEFDEICTKHGIRYYLSGGSNLGALRHGGFIPWDDDADIRIPRRDYEKLEEVFDSEKKPARELVSHNRYPSYCSPIPRYMSLSSTSVTRGRMEDGTPHGDYIDMMILDPIPRDEEELQEWKYNHYAYCELMEPAQINAARKSNWEGINIDRYRMYREKAKKVGKEAVLNELAEKLFTIEEEDADNYCMRFGTMWLGINPIDWYGEPRRVPFEDRETCIASKAELCAYVNYGYEWRNIPHATGRTGHPTFRVEGLDSGNMERDYMSRFDADEYRNLLQNYKDLRIEHSEIKLETFESRVKPYARYLGSRIARDVKNLGEDYLIANPEEGIKVFRPYMRLQTSKEFSRNKVYVELDSGLTDLMARLCYMQNRITSIGRILEIRKTAVELSEYQQEILDFSNAMTDMMKAIDLGLYDEAEKILKAWEPEHSEQLMAVNGRLEILVHNAKAGETGAWEEARRLAEKALQNYPENGEILKLYGDALEGLGMPDEADEAYRKAVANTDNGMIINELIKRGKKYAADRMEEICGDAPDEDYSTETVYV